VLSEDDVQVKVTRGALVKELPEGMTRFSAEIYGPYKALGMAGKPTLPIKGDLGILSADAGGTAVAHRWYWSSESTQAITDMALEAAVSPATFGTLKF
jgi:hypothetical protein